MIRFVFAVFSVVLTAAPLAVQGSESPNPGLAYRVVDVAADDVLNVREQPGTAAAIVATLKPDAKGIVVSGLAQELNGSIWWQVLLAGAAEAGWVNARYLTAEDAHGHWAANFALRCGGTEPFWSLTIAGGKAQYTPLDGDSISMKAGNWIDAVARPRGYRFAVPLTRAGSQDAGMAAIGLAAPSCSDGMSDIEYPYGILLVLPGFRTEGQVYEGCCHRAR